MAYITKANAKRIITRISFTNFEDIDGDVYKKPIFFLSSWERKNLLLMKSLLKEPEKFAIEMYEPIVIKDKYRYVYETEDAPAYHYDITCENLHSDFKNFEIPNEIKIRAKEKALFEGKNEVEINKAVKDKVCEFRRWFKKNLRLFYHEPDKFLLKLEVRWNIKRRINEIELENSGIEFVDNLCLNDLEAEIDKFLRQAAKFFNGNADKQEIIRRFQKLTFLAYTPENIKINDTDLTDDDLKRFLKQYDTQFKKPVKKLLIEYYRIKYNKNLSFDGKLLESLNFKPCSCCQRNNP